MTGSLDTCKFNVHADLDAFCVSGVEGRKHPVGCEVVMMGSLCRCIADLHILRELHRLQQWVGGTTTSQ